MNPSYKSLSLIASICFLLLSSNIVNAHARWAVDSITPPRDENDGLKQEPCGDAVRTSRPTIFSGGQTIEVEFEETVNHPGYYRIAFSPANDLNFDSYVLEPNIPDNTNRGFYRQEITLPTETCAACTLQLIQYMTESSPPSLYYSCSDIQITNPGDTTAPNPVNTVVPTAGNGQVTINWNNPPDDFYRTVILKNTNNVMGAPTNGNEYVVGDMIDGSEVVYVGNESNFTEGSLTNDQDYYFKVFSQNPRKNYAAGVEIVSTPSAGSTPDEGAGSTDDTSGDTNTETTASTDTSSGAIHIGWLFVLVMFSRIFRQK